jgi:hypothetical protein
LERKWWRRRMGGGREGGGEHVGLWVKRGVWGKDKEWVCMISREM